MNCVFSSLRSIYIIEYILQYFKNKYLKLLVFLV